MKEANSASKVAIPVSLMLVNLAIDTQSSTVFYFFIKYLELNLNSIHHNICFGNLEMHIEKSKMH